MTDDHLLSGVKVYSYFALDRSRMVSEEEFFQAGLIAIKEDGPEAYLHEVLGNLKGNWVWRFVDSRAEPSLGGVKLCNRCTEKRPGKWDENLPGRSARTARRLSDILSCGIERLARRMSRGVGSKGD